MVDEIAPSFYTKGGQIAESAPAEEIARLENPVHVRETSLKKEFEEGLTAEQKKNIEIRDGVEKKYPHAFKTIESESGKVLMATGKDKNRVFFGKNGGFAIPGASSEKGHLPIEQADENKLVELINDPDGDKHMNDLWRGSGDPEISFRYANLVRQDFVKENFVPRLSRDTTFTLMRADLTREDGRKYLSGISKEAEENGKEEAKSRSIINVPTEDILAGL